MAFGDLSTPSSFGTRLDTLKKSKPSANAAHGFPDPIVIPPTPKSNVLPADDWPALKDVLDIISNPKWTWARNARCKYLVLRLDTRDQHCLIADRDGNRITLEQLKAQHGQ